MSSSGVCGDLMGQSNRFAKIDATQKAIRDFLRKAGMKIRSLSGVGDGIPDLLASYRGVNHLIEIKNGEIGWKLTPAQKEFHATWQAPIVILDSVDAAIQWISTLNKGLSGER